VQNKGWALVATSSKEATSWSSLLFGFQFAEGSLAQALYSDIHNIVT
jgi:hypothetical protein